MKLLRLSVAPFFLIAALISACAGNSGTGALPMSVNSENGANNGAPAAPFSNAIATKSGSGLVDVSQMPAKASIDPDVLAFAQRLKRENPELAGLRIVQIDSTWHAAPETPANVVPDATSNFSCTPTGPYSESWDGNAPPNCDAGTSAGPFRGVFSVRNKVAAEAFFTLPNNGAPNMPTVAGYGQGFIYLDAWPAPSTNNAEGGLQFDAKSDEYVPYVSGGNPGTGGQKYDDNYSVQPGTKMLIWEGAVDQYSVSSISGESGTCSSFGGCAGFYFAYPLPGVLDMDTVRISDYGMNPSSGTCCIFQRMTTIAVTNGNLFVGPSPSPGVPPSWTFGPVTWSRFFTEHYNPNASPSPSSSGIPQYDVPDGNGFTNGWVLGTAQNRYPDPAGYTNFPNCPASPYVSATPYTNAEVETDTIYVPASLPTSC